MNFRQTHAHEGVQQISQVHNVQGQETLHFSLHKLLPPGNVLALALQPDASGFLCLLENTPTGPRMVAHQSFTAREISLLQPLLANYPAYAPYEM